MKYQAVIFLLYILLTSTSYAQTKSGELIMSVEKDATYDQKKIISSIVKLKNQTNANFSGFITLSLPQGLKAISSDTILAQVDKSDSTFIPIRLIETGSAPAGRTSITLKLLDQNKKLLRQQSNSIYIQDNNAMKLDIENQSVFVTNDRDSIRIKAVVTNLGNKNQYVTVVFGLLNDVGQRYFIEQKKMIPLKSEAVFNMSFLPSEYIFRQQNTNVSVTALRGTQKDLIDNSLVTIQTVNSTRSYRPPQDLNYGLYYANNSITAMFRQIGDFANAFQLMGNGNINLPVGNIALRGNLYKSNTQDEIVATNTAISYQLNNHEFTIGNINEVLEYSLFGRGASITLGTKEMKQSLKVGFSDANFNLFSPRPFLENGYSVFGVGTLGNRNSGKVYKADFLYRDSPLENATHTMIGGESQMFINNDWNLRVQAHGAISNYSGENSTKPSFSTALQYSGRIKEYNLNGNYYFSTDYFPGNRRGNAQAHQMISRPLAKGAAIWANVFFMNLSPKYVQYTSSILTRNIISNIGYTFPKFKTMNLGLGYQNQAENSNAYNIILSENQPADILNTQAHRGTLLLNWHSPNYKNLITIQTEAGAAKYSTENATSKTQLKVNTSYTYKWFNLNSTYQYGSFFLSEYATSTVNGKPFKRLTVNASVNKTLANNKLITNIGAGYSKDYIMGNTPSLLANLKYLINKKYHVFTNSSWYQYTFLNQPSRDLFSVEGGLTYNFNDNYVSTAKKSKVNIFVYLDKNSNNVYDRGDVPAADYFVSIGETSFVTNIDGKFTYKMVPFGNYSIKPIKDNGWFYEGGTLFVSNLSVKQKIPLKQMGSVSTSIIYNFDEQKSLEFTPKAGGIAFSIFKDGHLTTRLSTDDLGKIMEFLPSGKYHMELDATTLPENTYSNNTTRDFEISSGKITALPAFEIEVKSKRINIKRFGD